MKRAGKRSWPWKRVWPECKKRDNNDIGKEGDDGEPVEIESNERHCPHHGAKGNDNEQGKSIQPLAAQGRQDVWASRRRLRFGNKRRQYGRYEQDCEDCGKRKLKGDIEKGRG